MFGNAAPTPYDLRFSLFGIPVRVHPLFWVVNLLVVLPVDGGRISSAALSHWRPYDGEQVAIKLSIVTAIGVVVLAFQQHDTFVAIFFASLAFSNFQDLQGGGRFR